MTVPAERTTRARPVTPYKGLASFEDSALDALLFFGREREREVVAANLVAARLTVLYGPSGVGKSSILAAGVARDLRALPEQPLVVVHDTWADAPAEALAAAVAGAAGCTRGTLAETVEIATALHGELYLLLDQIEEYFVYHGSDPALGDALAELVARTELPVHLLLGVREDALANLDAFKARIPGLLANRLRLDHLGRAAARRAIVGPIERFAELVPEEEGLAVEPALIDAVLDGVRAGAVVQSGRGRGVSKSAGGEQRVETPYLQVVMQRLWEVERGEGSRVLRLRTLERLGGPSRIVEEHLERALAALTPAQKELAARMFNHLVTPSGTKIAHGAADLAGYAAASPGELDAVLDALGRERILRPVGGDGAAAAHEIFHDVLADAVLAWRGRFEAERALERERAAASRRQRRLLAVVAASLVALTAMAAVTVFALTQRSDARRSASAAQASAQEARLQRRDAVRARGSAQAAAALAQRQAARARTAEARAKEQRREAVRQAAIAQAETRKADAAAVAAGTERATALEQRALAEHQSRVAVAARQEAQRRQHEALAAKQEAQQRQREAVTAANAAERQRTLAQRAARTARAGEKAATAVSLLTSDPARGVRFALEAVGLEPTRHHVDVLRASIVADRLRAILPGSGGHVTDAVFGRAGSRVVVTSERGPALLYRADGTLVAKLAPATGAAFSADGGTLATWGTDGAALWDAATGARTGGLVPGASVTAFAFSPDGKLVAAGTGGAARVWTAAGEPVSTLQHGATVTSIDFDSSGARAITVARDSAGRLQARIFDVRSGELRQLLNERGISSATFSPDGSRVATTSSDRTARYWDPATGAELERMTHDGVLVGGEFSRDGKLFVAANQAGGASVWDLAGARQVQMVGPTNRVTSAAFSPDAQFVVLSSLDGTARVYRTSDGLQAAKLLGHAGGVLRAAYGGDDGAVVTAGEDGTARVWDTGLGTLLSLVGRHDGAVNVARIGPTGGIAATAGDDGTARIWRLGGGPTLVLRHDGAVADVQFGPDGRLVLTGSQDGTARLWRTATGEQVRVFASGSPVTAVAYSPSGALISSGDALWRVADGARVASLAGPATAVAFTSDGTLLATGARDGTVRLWDGRTGAPLRTLRGHTEAVGALSFSPDGSRLATASTDGTGRLWRVADGTVVAVLGGHSAALTDIEFSRDGTRLVTTSADSDGRVWDGRTGRLVEQLRGHFGAVQDGSFSPDGRWIVTAGPFTAGLWSTATGKLFAPTGADDPYLRGTALPLTSAVFGPNGRRILVASRDGSVRTFVCDACGDVPQLKRLAHALLREAAPR